MNVIAFLCLSICSSTVQLHNSLGCRRVCACSEAGFSSQNGDRAWRLYYRRAAFCFAFFRGKKDSMQETVIKKYFLFTVGSAYRLKRLTTGSRNSFKDVRKSHMMPYQLRNWLRQQSKDFYAGDIDALVKRRNKYMNVGGGSLQVRISHVLRFISICDLFTDSSLYISIQKIHANKERPVLT
jgi:hypothetical protein